MKRLPWMLAGLVAVAAAATTPAGATRPTAVTLGPVVRVTTPGDTPCGVEGEPDVVVTSAGTWVGYNDDSECVYTYYLGELRRLTSLQLIPAKGGPPRYVTKLLPPKDGERLLGDPALAPDPRTPGGVLIATLYQSTAGDAPLEVFRVSPSLAVSKLPSPAVHPAGQNSDDKEFLASDANPRSRWFGRVYLIWDDFRDVKLRFRAFDGRRWLPSVVLGDLGRGDVAVAPNGDVAVAYEASTGVAVQVSRDGGRTFGEPSLAITGAMPGRTDPNCPLRSVVGQRQRATKAVRVAYDSTGRLHVVAAVAPRGGLPRVGVLTGGAAQVVHAVSAGGETWHPTVLGDPAAVRFHPAVAGTPSGGVAVAWLETSDAAQTSYDAWLAVAPRGSRTFGKPVRLSTAPATFPSAMEAQLNSNCYGIGDYIGLATTPRGVVTVWPTTDAETLPQVDSDVLAREAYLR